MVVATVACVAGSLSAREQRAFVLDQKQVDEIVERYKGWETVMPLERSREHDEYVVVYANPQAARAVRTGHTPFPTDSLMIKAGFKDAALRDAFNRGIAELCKSGRYAEVLRKYHVELPQTICDR